MFRVLFCVFQVSGLALRGERSELRGQNFEIRISGARSLRRGRVGFERREAKVNYLTLQNFRITQTLAGIGARVHDLISMCGRQLQNPLSPAPQPRGL